MATMMPTVTIRLDDHDTARLDAALEKLRDEKNLPHMSRSDLVRHAVRMIEEQYGIEPPQRTVPAPRRGRRRNPAK